VAAAIVPFLPCINSLIHPLNAKIGRERAYENAIRNHTLNETANRDGELIC
jgi:hypothetical protein